MIAEKIKTEKYLERARQLKRMIGTKKELDDIRRAIRNYLEELNSEKSILDNKKAFTVSIADNKAVIV